MYTFAPTSLARRSAQTVLWKITEALARLVAPILSFTADEVWDYLPFAEGREASVHLAQFPKSEEIFSGHSTPLLEEWNEIFIIRDQALQLLESARQDKMIGKSLEADIHVFAKGEALSLFRCHAAELKELLNVSSVAIHQWGEKPPSKEGQRWKTSTPSENHSLWVFTAAGSKCARCWNFMPEVSAYGIWQNVCTRCQGALTEMGIKPPQAEEIAS
jgi:isoleucyl-tRNA synthetase